MRKIISTAIVLSALALTFTQCSKDETDNGQITPTPTPVEVNHMIGEATMDVLGVDIKVYADTTPFVGYNRIYTEIKSNNKTNGNFQVEYLPEMDMGMMTHRCPIENPTLNSQNIYEGALIFIMESAGMGEWVLEIKVTDLDNSKTESVVFPLNVVGTEEAKVFSFISDQGGQPIFVTLVEPTKPFVGINDYEIAIHSRENHNSFPPITDLIVEMEPEMPTMGHGSPDNENPVHMENGHYTGKVNFTMPGYWKVNMDFKTNTGDIVKEGTSFDITF